MYKNMIYVVEQRMMTGILRQNGMNWTYVFVTIPFLLCVHIRLVNGSIVTKFGRESFTAIEQSKIGSVIIDDYACFSDARLPFETVCCLWFSGIRKLSKLLVLRKYINWKRNTSLSINYNKDSVCKVRIQERTAMISIKSSSHLVDRLFHHLIRTRVFHDFPKNSVSHQAQSASLKGNATV